MNILETEKLTNLYEQALETYQANGKNDYDAGVVEGIKRVIELLNADPA